MSKKFSEQDYFRYKRLGTRWRKPRGRQSKLRISKGGSGIRPRIGYGTGSSKRIAYASSIDEARRAEEGSGIIIRGAVGLKKFLEIYRAAQQSGLKILNTRKIKKALKREKELEKKSVERKAKKETRAEKPRGGQEKQKGQE